MALKRANVAATAAVETKSDIPVIRVDGEMITRFNKASSDMKDAEALVKELKPDVNAKGQEEIIKYNINHPMDPISSIKLMDSKGQMARVSFTEKYGAADADAASTIFESLGADINDSVVENTIVELDRGAFLDAEGNFDEKFYTALHTAIEKVAKQHGKKNPVTTKLVVQPKPGFHAKRWALFPTLEEQLQLGRALPNTVTVTANSK